MAADADTSAGHSRHLHLVEDTGHQALQHCEQRVAVHRLVDVVARLVAAAAAHTPDLLGYARVQGFVIKLLLVCVESV